MNRSGGLRAIAAGGRLAGRLASDPVEAWFRLREKLMDRQEGRRPRCPYAADADWERRLHAHLGAPWPCPEAAEFRELWPAILGSLRAKGLEVGVGFFAGWNDGEPESMRAIWCLTRHLRPARVVETGVARGITSRIVLEALERNGSGHLWSIDLPQLLRPELNEQVGAAVDQRLRRRWSYVEGSSRRRLPGLLARLGQIDLFIHDSRHTEYNTRFELEQAWSRLRPGGVAVADDIDTNWGFRAFTAAHPGHPALVCPAMPPQQDPRRWNGSGLFGIVRKEAARLRVRDDLAAHAG
jgi:predicted O-methyltransferase YrrM